MNRQNHPLSAAATLPLTIRLLLLVMILLRTLYGCSGKQVKTERAESAEY